MEANITATNSFSILDTNEIMDRVTTMGVVMGDYEFAKIYIIYKLEQARHELNKKKNIWTA